jgi:hypothetical protein
MTCWIGMTLAVGTLVSRPARADHHGEITSEGPDRSSFQASVALVAARFDSMFFGGDYEGVIPAVQWSGDGFGVAASMPLYRLESNGFRTYGLGDLVLQGQARLVGSDERHAGVGLAFALPTGGEVNGLGMGHIMAMPSAYGSLLVDRVRCSASVGFGRALDLEQHVHGMWPLVAPMNMSEVTWSGGAEIGLGHHASLATRVSGGVPVGAPGIDRVVGGVRGGWGTGNVSTALELQAGIVGDPFTVRAIVETMVRF